MSDIIRRKIAQRVAKIRAETTGVRTLWPLAFARACKKATGLVTEAGPARLERCGVSEILESLPENALVTLVDGPAEGLGLIALSSELAAGLMEMQTIGRLLAGSAETRRPTRTDAMMTAEVLERSLAEFDMLLARDEDQIWAGGFQRGSFLEDTRPLELLLDEPSYQLLSVELSFVGTARRGKVLLALPTEGRGKTPVPVRNAAEQSDFSAAFAKSVMGADCQLRAVLARFTMPLNEVLSLEADQFIELPSAKIDAVNLEGMDGHSLFCGSLGQFNGMRALRLTDSVKNSRDRADVKKTAVSPSSIVLPDRDDHADIRDSGSDGGLVRAASGR